MKSCKDFSEPASEESQESMAAIRYVIGASLAGIRSLILYAG
jgi:hypothetical protein